MAGQKNEQGTLERKRRKNRKEQGSKQSKYESLNTL